MIRTTVGFISSKYSYNLVSRFVLPVKYNQLCLHTSRLLNVKGKEITMPSLSPTMESGTIVKWLKKEGDPIQPGDAIADIQTDKAVMTFETEEESIMAKIIAAEGTKDIKVGTVIALTVEPDEDWKSVEMPDASRQPAASSASVSAPASAPSSSSNEVVEPPPGQTNVAMPALSPTMTSGTIVKWLKNEGDEISPGDAVAEIQTDKAVMTFEMEDDAILAKYLVKEGSQVDVGQLIAITVEKGMDWKSAVIPTSTKAVAKESSTAAPPKATPSQIYGLAVKRLLEEYAISSGSVKGSGRPNRLLKSDVLAHIESNKIQKVFLKAAPTTKTQISAPLKSGPSTYTDHEVSNIRAVIAKRLGESKSSIPHSYITIDVNIDKLNELRSELKAENLKVSMNDFVIQAVAQSLIQCPPINSIYKNEQVTRIPNVDVSIAVSTPTGLITPIIFDTVKKSLTDISNDVKSLADKARKGTLKPNEFQGGTFTISNLGMFGIKEFSAIINPPQTAILAVGTGRDVLDTSLRKKSMMSATLSYDSRAISEDQAANFLSVLRSRLENPSFRSIGSNH
ncbi:GSCOCG00012253001-RA-CDS [Cotesia congregata]|nr:GSCOCG00012253001-RA-CDS [Cotesia congregata]